MVYKIVISLDNSLCVGSGYGYAKLCDQTTVRDEHDIAIIPGSTIKGKLRSACKRLALSAAGEYQTPPVCQTTGVSDSVAAMCKDASGKCIICRIFGSPLFPSPYRFSDLKLDQTICDHLKTMNKVRSHVNPAGMEQVTRVRMNRYFNTAERNALYTIEQVVWNDLVFYGSVTGPKLDDTECKMLKHGLKTITHIGRGRAHGLGAINHAGTKLFDPDSD